MVLDEHKAIDRITQLRGQLEKGERATLRPRRAELPLVVIAMVCSQSDPEDFSPRMASSPFEAILLAIV